MTKNHQYNSILNNPRKVNITRNLTQQAMDAKNNQSVIQNNHFYRTNLKSTNESRVINHKNMHYQTVEKPASFSDNRRFINNSDKFIDNGYSNYNNNYDKKVPVSNQAASEKILHLEKNASDKRFNENFVIKRDSQHANKYGNFMTLPKGMDVNNMKAINNPQNYIFLKNLLTKDNNRTMNKKPQTQESKRFSKSSVEKKRKFNNLLSKKILQEKREMLTKVNQSIGFKVSALHPTVNKIN